MRRSWLFCRVTTGVIAALVVLQPLLAGGFLSGYYDLLRLHRLTGFALVGVAVVQAVAVVVLRRAGGPREVLVPGLMLPVLFAVQGLLGLERVLWLHVPFGVLMVIGNIRLAATVWRAPSASPAPGRTEVAA